MSKEEYRGVLTARLNGLRKILGDRFKGSHIEIAALITLECDLCEKLYRLDNEENKLKETFSKLLAEETTNDNEDYKY